MTQFLPISGFALSEAHPIGIWLSPSPLGHHVGIALRNADGTMQALHLGWHHSLYWHKLDTQKKGIVIAKTGLDDFSARIFHGVASNIPKYAPKIGYGANWLGARGSFNGSQYSAPPNSDGLTCATFVSEAFKGAGHHIVNEEDWPENTPENKEWLAEVIKALEETLEPSPEKDAHIANIRSRDSIVRLKPPEIAGAVASNSDDWPLAFDKTSELAAAVLADFAAASKENTVQQDADKPKEDKPKSLPDNPLDAD